MKQINAYRCDYCGKLYRKIDAIIRHEKWCNKNPIHNYKCFHQCDHLELVEIEFSANDYADTMRHSKCFHCNKLHKYFFTLSAMRRNIGKGEPIYNDNNEIEQEKMPLECKHHNNACFNTIIPEEYLEAIREEVRNE